MTAMPETGFKQTISGFERMGNIPSGVAKKISNEKGEMKWNFMMSLSPEDLSHR